eukprot:3896042-Amphidinium_carterae.1
MALAIIVLSWKIGVVCITTLRSSLWIRGPGPRVMFALKVQAANSKGLMAVDDDVVRIMDRSAWEKCGILTPVASEGCVSAASEAPCAPSCSLSET